MADKPVRKFTFGVEFAEDGKVLRDEKIQRVWNEDEIAAERAQAREAGAREAQAQAAREQAAALKAMAGQLQLVLAHLSRLTEELRADATALALAAAKKIAHSAVERFPTAEIEALTEACAAELRAAPRLKVTLPAAHADVLRPKLEEMLAGIGFAGALQVTESQTMAPGGCALDWEHGSAESDPARMSDHIESLVGQRLQEAPPPVVNLFADWAKAAEEGES